jgi:hypothetical protein
MASIQVFRIEFLVNNPYGGFVSGDVLDVYVDDTLIVTTDFIASDGISVNLNGSPLLSSAFLILDFGQSIVSVTQYKPQICVGTSLTTFFSGGIWPFAYYSSLADHYSCIVNPPTCDLIVVGTPLIIPATSETTSDGVITVTATSSNTIQYKLGSDFVYGSESTSGIFSSLLPGSYRIFLRDSSNCGANVLVIVGFSDDYGPIYRLEYTDSVAGFTTKIDITKRGYAGAVSGICGSGNPFQIQLRGEGETDKFASILSSQGNLNLTSETEGFFETLYTNDSNLYRVEFYKDTGSGEELMWVGKILPFIYSEQIQSPPYYITVTATDGLPELKDLYLIQEDGQKFYGSNSLIKIIAQALNLIGLDLNIRVAVNMYATGMGMTDSDDPFDQAYIDYECFYLADKEPSMDFVVRSILDAFNCRLVQWDGVWNIIRVEENITSYDYREFDSVGDYVSNGSFDPVIDVNYPSTNGLMWEAFPNKEIQKGYGQIKVKYKLGLRPNIINNGDYRLQSTYNQEFNRYDFQVNTDGFTLVNAGYPLTTGYENIDEGNIAYYISGGEDMLFNTESGEAYIQAAIFTLRMATANTVKINIRYKVNRASVTLSGRTYTIEVPYVKVRIRIKYGSQYLQNDGSWTSSENILVFFLTTFNEYVESEIVANQPVSGTPASGMDFDLRVYHAYAYHAQFDTVSDLEAFPTYTAGNDVIPTGYKTELRDSFVAISYIYYYVLTETTASASGYDIIRPDDYHSTNNPRQWVLQGNRVFVGTISGANIFPMFIDRIKGTYLVNGKDPSDTIIRVANAEPLNKETFEKELVIGSYSNLIVTETNLSLDLGVFFPNATPGLTITTTNILSADLIYTGWIRDSTGVGYELWTRDGIAEASKLHAIWLSSYSAEYSRSWRLIRGSTVSKTLYFGLLNVINDVNDNDRKYIPISLTLDDLNNRVSGEFLEMSVSVDGAGSDGSPSSPFSSGFSTGFGSSGFN